jgi:diguanylate cyclase (GGDEF)-like protein
MCNQPVGIAFADVNGLKKINDNLGHEAGDELLAAIAKKIITIFQEAGCYRFGGDEFIILSFDKSETDFQNKLQKLSKLWTAECLASIGSVWLEHAKDIEKNLSVADEKMYVNKNYYYKNRF